jgi:magnesium chelatase family protein
MVSHVSTLTFSGINIQDVDVQVHIAPGIPAFTIVGLADKTIGESRERVKAALSSIGLALPAKKITINLAPADLVKEGSHFDLAIAAALLTAMQVLPADEIQEYLILGELGLDGSILPVAGALPAAVGAVARDLGLICPEANGREAAWSGNQNIVAAPNLLSLINHFKGTQLLKQPTPEYHADQIKHPDFADIIGQETAKRAVEITAAGGHNLLMSGPPGAGKSMLAQRLPGILPAMTPEEILECSTIASIAGLITDGKLSAVRPFRAPHHSCSMAAMVGGGVGKRVKPGEISLAHHGVLCLDELPEFPSTVLDALRQPMENREVLIARANSHVKFPANFQLIAAMNPCKCGYLTDAERACGKAPRCGQDYQMRISGPILDRFDLHIEVAAVDFLGVTSRANYKSESSKQIAERVKIARQIQLDRFSGYGIRTNAELSGQIILDFATPVNQALELLNEAANKLKFSMRSYNRVLKVARTIADLEGAKQIERHHIAEALSYRELDYYRQKKILK